MIQHSIHLGGSKPGGGQHTQRQSSNLSRLKHDRPPCQTARCVEPTSFRLLFAFFCRDCSYRPSPLISLSSWVPRGLQARALLFQSCQRDDSSFEDSNNNLRRLIGRPIRRRAGVVWYRQGPGQLGASSRPETKQDVGILHGDPAWGSPSPSGRQCDIFYVQ